MRWILLALTLLPAPLIAGDEDTTTSLDPVLVTATRSPAAAFDTPYAAESIAEGTIRKRAYRTTPQVLRDLPGVMVQETAVGHGSPYIRGFTSFRNLFLIDGIRLNNSVFREGPNQYWNTVDPYSIGRIEVVKGPASVLYGSDAIGGTVQAFSKAAPTFAGRSGHLYLRGASAEESFLGRGELGLGAGDKTGFLGGLTGKHFGDLRAGSPTGTQPETGYDEWAGDLKLEHFLGEKTRLVLAAQHVQHNNVPRTHKTIFAKSFRGTDVGSELQRDLDQERWLVYAQLHKENIGSAVDVVRASLSWHSQSEVRDRIRTGSRRDKQGFDVGTLGAWLQLESDSAIGRLTYGIEYYRDIVDSFSTSNPIQGPVADDATYDLLGAYLQTVFCAGERWEFILGLRFTWAAVDADRVADPDTGQPFAISDSWSAPVGSARFRYDLVPEVWNLFGGVSQGFRTPNLSDLTRFDSARSNEFETPAPGLDPEDYVQFEIGAKGRKSTFNVQLSLFYTLIHDQIVRVPTGSTNTDGEAEVTKANVGDGWLWGIELGGAWRFADEWTLFGNATYLEGKVDTFPTSQPIVVREYMSRLMPPSAQAGVRWDQAGKRFWAELSVLAVADADRLSTRDRSDTQRIPPGGTPGYVVVHLRGGWNITEKVALIGAVENLLDKDYRVHGSGHNMPGLNFVGALSVDF